MSKNLNDLYLDLDAAVNAHIAFDRHMPDPNRMSFDNFIEMLKESESVSILNAMMHVCRQLEKDGYEPK